MESRQGDGHAARRADGGARDPLSRRLVIHEFGEPGGRPLVCLHGVTSHGHHFARLARRLPGVHVLAPDLLGHAGSPWEPPWDIDAHVDAVLDTVADEEACWLGHSFGGRLAFEIAARAPSLVERLVLLDPAILISPPAALWSAENARPERSYASFEEGIDVRFEESKLGPLAEREVLEEELRVHLVENDDGRWRYRYCQSAVVAAYGEMSSKPPPFEAVRAPTLLVLGRASYLPYGHLIDAHRAAGGDRLEVLEADGGHTLLWDAFEETADAIARFLSV